MQIIFFLSWPKKNNAPDSIPVASPSRDRALWVGLSRERGTIAATASRELQGQHRSSVSRSRGAGGYVGSYGNAIDPIKMHAHQNLLVTHFLKPLHDRPRSPFSVWIRKIVILTRSIIDPRISHDHIRWERLTRQRTEIICAMPERRITMWEKLYGGSVVATVETIPPRWRPPHGLVIICTIVGSWLATRALPTSPTARWLDSSARPQENKHRCIAGRLRYVSFLASMMVADKLYSFYD